MTDSFGGTTRRGTGTTSETFGYYPGKRLLDLIIATAGLVIAAPCLASAGIAILMEAGRPIIYRQVRIGRNEKPFVVYKLRTMTVEDHQYEQTEPHSRGVTRVGRFLRVSKADELPQLWNVLRGEMSAVGPRPCLSETVAEFDDVERRRFEMRPGLTGLAQVNGNTEIDWHRRCAYDLAYGASASLAGDLVILARTVVSVVRRKA